jgi:NHS family xanthosine MFS transporter
MDDHYVLCVVYGMAFDFFNISGSLFLKPIQNQKSLSAQGLFMMMTNGFGAVLGSFTSDGLLINILQSHLVARMICWFSEETTNPKMLEFI